MSNYKDSPKFNTHNDYYTPKYAWEDIKPFIDKKGYKKVFECFLLNSNEQSKEYLNELGYNTLGTKDTDFLDNTTWSGDMIMKNYDIIVSNPPFERIKSYKQRKSNLKYKCIEKLLKLDKPFIILMNSTNIFQKWFKELVEEKDIKFIFPSKKIEYDKYKEGGLVREKSSGSCSFNSVYVCYNVLDKNEWI